MDIDKTKYHVFKTGHEAFTKAGTYSVAPGVVMAEDRWGEATQPPPKVEVTTSYTYYDHVPAPGASIYTGLFTQAWQVTSTPAEAGQAIVDAMVVPGGSK